MCFFKGLNAATKAESAMTSPQKVVAEDTSAEFLSQCDFFSIPDSNPKSSGKPDLNLMLMNCLGMASINSQMMFAMQQKLQQTQDILSSSDLLFSTAPTSQQGPTRKGSPFPQDSYGRDTKNTFQTSDGLTRKLFGESKYRYKLEVDGELPDTLYKERNFGLNVKLIDLETGKNLNNGNIINICLGVCDDNAEWIHETKEGQTFLKGKIQAELYHGTATFIKMAAKDVSRIYLNKTVNFVVYPKPTVLRYSGESSIEEHVDFSLIEPLVVHGISIKAKKRD